MDDKELQELICTHFQRDELTQEIQQEVMKTIRREQRATMLRHWVHLVSFSFGLPLLLALFAWAFVHIQMQESQSALVKGCLWMPLVFLCIYATDAMRKFSIEKL